jgi:hypothetical protein
LSHRPDILSTSITPTQGNFLLPVSPPSSSWSLHAEFVSTCSGWLINFGLGPGQFWPSPNGWVGSGSARPLFF